MQFIRVADGRPVARDEACLPGGMVKSGYSVRVGMIADGQRVTFMDSAPITDRGVTLTDAEATLAVARSRQVHDAAHRYLGSRAPAFSDAHVQAALANAAAKKRAATVTQSAALIRDAETVSSRFVRDEAHNARKAAIRNGWRQ